jgi:hypothetical protein
MHHSASSIVQNSLPGRCPSLYHKIDVYLMRLVRALKPPGYYPEWHIGVRVSKTKKLVAFISGVPMSLRIREKSVIQYFYLSLLLISMLQLYSCDRDQLSLRAQETALQATSPSADQRSYTASPPQRHIPGDIHSGSRDPYPSLHLPILPPSFECPQTSRHQILLCTEKYDPRKDDAGEQAS